ncbi:hypothetical protein BKA70DRAFT_113722 [Coprinopsis sp. MPI-PUGE-AT-0042]|nr:hypothetical protein BKA70DRAFT_113722 [Coprinopsis sp. MPI-PUGE-AT-0042]
MKAPPSMIAGISFGYLIAVLSTALRLFLRRKRQQLWWDDFWAVVALFMLLAMVALDIVRFWKELEQHPVRVQSFIVWFSLWAQPTVVWSSRMSTQATIIHFLPEGQNRIISMWALGCLGLCWLISGIVKFFYNGIPIPVVPGPPWGQMPTAVNIGLSLLATVWLIVWPASIVMRMQLRQRAKRTLLVCFGSALPLFALEVFHCVNLMVNAYKLIEYSGRIELLSSVVLSNMVIVVTFIYQRLNPDVNHRRSTVASSSEQGDDSRGGVTATAMTQFTSLVEPLTDLSGDILTDLSNESKAHSIIPKSHQLHEKSGFSTVPSFSSDSSSRGVDQK